MLDVRANPLSPSLYGSHKFAMTSNVQKSSMAKNPHAIGHDVKQWLPFGPIFVKKS
jgi:hypothetical protein